MLSSLAELIDFDLERVFVRPEVCDAFAELDELWSSTSDAADVWIIEDADEEERSGLDEVLDGFIAEEQFDLRSMACGVKPVNPEGWTRRRTSMGKRMHA